ncbi:MAG TPA: ABC transporter permease [Acidobacteriaceae bacterium]|nr:ABC transporter permease [Acidobacteriaceae bacterium]
MASNLVPKPELDKKSFDSTLASANTTMIFSEVLSLAGDSFRASKARFLLTMLGMVIGSASIILVVTVGLTGKQYALDTISGLGPNKIEMQYRGGSIIGPDNTTTPDSMTREDMEAVHDTVPGIDAYSPLLEDHERISLGGGITNDTMLLGVSPQYKQVRGLIVLAGRFFDDQDADSHAKVALLNQPLAIKLFGSEQAAVDRNISIHGIPLTIIGVFKESIDTYGTSEINDQTILIPYEVVRYFTGTDNIKEIFFKMADSSMVASGAIQITNLIQHRHRPNSVYHAETLLGILNTMDKVANDLTWMLVIVAAITLVVGGVGIMNSMLANVQSRTHEIGIRKALGATRREIRLQFLTEAVFLSFSGGIVGTIVGLGIPISIGLLTPYTIPVGWLAAPIALATSVIVGVIFGTVPANRAARLNPVDTLKYE